jgi:DNA-binding transcriptional MerR regulator
VIAELAAQLPQVLPKNGAKLVARALGVSIRTGKRYINHPELFPRSRVEQLLAFLEEQDREAERRARERREERERLANQFRQAVGLLGPELPGAHDRLPGRDVGGAVERSGSVVPQERSAP